MKGQIINLRSDDFFALADGEVYRLKARGKLKGKESLLVGDYVEFSNGAVEKVLPRKNRFIRPSVANADLIAAVISPVPEPDFIMLDKLIASAVSEGVPVIFIVNKSDISKSVYEKVKNEYSAVGEIFSVSATEKVGLEELKTELKNKFTVLAGQSAVGKSSLVNALFGCDLKVGEVSEIGRGRHTTTYSKIYDFDDVRIADTPGFAVLESFIEADDLKYCYPEFNEYLGECKFRGCSHTGEPDCKIEELVGEGKIPFGRFERYKEIYSELKRRKKFYE